MYVACSTLCFTKVDLDESLRTIRTLQFAKADLAIHEAGPHLKPSDVLADVSKTAARLKAANVPFAAFHLRFAEHDSEKTREELRGCCRLARVLAVPVVTVSSAKLGADEEGEVSRLQEWVKIAQAEGVILTVETEAGKMTADVKSSIELCKRVPSLGLTLDPTYYMMANLGDAADPLYPYVQHVRLRDSGVQAHEYQLRIGQGMIEHGRVISQLERYEYERALTVDVRDMVNCDFPVEPEVRKLKFLLESMV
jgi:sugar phosphate isomerase/epimerase